MNETEIKQIEMLDSIEHITDDTFFLCTQSATEEVDNTEIQTGCDYKATANQVVDYMNTKALNTIRQSVTNESQRAINKENEISQKLENIVPPQANANNQLADKDFVNNAIETKTANFMKSDSFSESQWASINSGVTSEKLAQLEALAESGGSGGAESSGVSTGYSYEGLPFTFIVNDINDFYWWLSNKTEKFDDDYKGDENANFERVFIKDFNLLRYESDDVIDLTKIGTKVIVGMAQSLYITGFTNKIETNFLNRRNNTIIDNVQIFQIGTKSNGVMAGAISGFNKVKNCHVIVNENEITRGNFSASILVGIVGCPYIENTKVEITANNSSFNTGFVKCGKIANSKCEIQTPFMVGSANVYGAWFVHEIIDSDFKIKTAGAESGTITCAAIVKHIKGGSFTIDKLYENAPTKNENNATVVCIYVLNTTNTTGDLSEYHFAVEDIQDVTVTASSDFNSIGIDVFNYENCRVYRAKIMSYGQAGIRGARKVADAVIHYLTAYTPALENCKNVTGTDILTDFYEQGAEVYRNCYCDWGNTSVGYNFAGGSNMMI